MVAEKRLNMSTNLLTLMIVSTLILTLVNLYILVGVSSSVGGISGLATGTLSTGSGNQLTGSSLQSITEKVIPTGTPEYGDEIGVSYDEPEESLSVLASYDVSIPTSSLSTDELARYINIGTQISCEFCCSVPAIITQTGQAACGCEHSIAMRGLAKYLIQNHPEYSDAEVLEELTKWKALFFPRQMIQREIQLQVQSGQIDASILDQLPDMVGDC